MKIDILTLFPEMFTPLTQSILGKAAEKGIKQKQTGTARGERSAGKIAPAAKAESVSERYAVCSAMVSLRQLIDCAGGKQMEVQNGRKENNEVLSEKEAELLALLRKLDYGEMRIIVQAGKPVRVEEIRKSIQL